MPTFISRGAESVILEDEGRIIKDRTRKSYRIPLLDEQLRKTRTRSEANILRKLNNWGFPVPALFDDDAEHCITMEKIQGKRLRDALTSKNCQKICGELGQLVHRLHSLGIIHGDLTTSNFMYRNGSIIIIDFGLSFYSHKIEDKAVDLHLLRQALESKHYQIWKKAFAAVLKGYADQDVEKRLALVESRGRNKAKY